MGKDKIDDLSNRLNAAVRIMEQDSAKNAQLLAMLVEKVEELAGDGEAVRPRKLPQGTKAITLSTRIMGLLDEQHTAEELAEETGASLEVIYIELGELEKRSKIRRTGSIEHPAWIRTLGDISTAATTVEVERLISADMGGVPRSQGELEKMTGARRSYVSGALTQLQRHKGAVPIAREGQERRQLWWIPPTVSVRGGSRDVIDLPSEKVRRRGRPRKVR